MPRWKEFQWSSISDPVFYSHLIRVSARGYKSNIHEEEEHIIHLGKVLLTLNIFCPFLSQIENEVGLTSLCSKSYPNSCAVILGDLVHFASLHSSKMLCKTKTNIFGRHPPIKDYIFSLFFNLFLILQVSPHNHHNLHQFHPYRSAPTSLFV